VLGIALLAWLLPGLDGRARFWVGAAAGVGWILPGFWWMTEFSLPGFVLASLLVSAFVGAAAALSPPGRWLPFGLGASLVVLEAFRGAWPFGGVPVATLAQTQVGGPVAEVARLGGPLLVTAAVAGAGIGLGSLARRRPRAGALSLAFAVAVTAAGSAVGPPPAGPVRTISLVQGGGERGTRAVDTDEGDVYEAHLEASQDVPEGVDVVLWPEDVIDIDEPFAGSEEAEELSALAERLGTTFVVGVVEDVDGDRFRNYVVAIGPDGALGDEYTKNQRVPFGEWIPFRSLVEQVADVSAVPRDATVGEGPGILDTDAGPLGVVISYEVFFARRARAAVTAGGEVLLAPTNASSYTTTQMPALEIGAARLRAIETGRWVAQAAPTGFSALVDPDGGVHHQTDLGRRQVVTAEVDLRDGRTPYSRVGDGPLVAAGLALLVGARVASVRRGTPGRRARRARREHGAPSVP
jgi:apolipoprotein N-acyltransferase